MVTISKRREVVSDFRATFRISERRACSLAGLGRSTSQYRSRRKSSDTLRARLRELAGDRPRYGYRRLHLLLRREGWSDNRKRVYRIYRLEGLAVRRRGRKRLRSRVRVQPPTPTRINQRWSMDFMLDGFSNGRRFRLLNLVDDFSREALVMEADTSLPGLRVVRALERLVTTRGLPEMITIDNGPEFTSCVLDAWACANGVISSNFRDPESPSTTLTSRASTAASATNALMFTGSRRCWMRRSRSRLGDAITTPRGHTARLADSLQKNLGKEQIGREALHTRRRSSRNQICQNPWPSFGCHVRGGRRPFILFWRSKL